MRKESHLQDKWKYSTFSIDKEKQVTANDSDVRDKMKGVNLTYTFYDM